jgi:hypothetical protein
MRTATIVGFMLVCGSAQPAEIYRCTDPGGVVTFSQTRCSAEARRIDLPEHRPIDRGTPPAAPHADKAAPESAPIDRRSPAALQTREREERARRERMRAMALEADRWGREASRRSIADEERRESSTQTHR